MNVLFNEQVPVELAALLQRVIGKYNSTGGVLCHRSERERFIKKVMRITK